MTNLGTKTTTDIGRDDTELVFGNIEDERPHQHANDVRVLARRIQGVFVPAAVVFADGRPRLNRVRYQAAIDDIDAGDMCRARERLVGRSRITDLPVEGDVIGRILPDGRCTFSARNRQACGGR